MQRLVCGIDFVYQDIVPNVDVSDIMILNQEGRAVRICEWKST